MKMLKLFIPYVLICIVNLVFILILNKMMSKELLSIILFIVFTVSIFIYYYSRKIKCTDKSNIKDKEYEGIINSLPGSVIIHDQDLIIYVNKTGREMLGKTYQECIIGQSIYHFIEPSYREIAKKRMQHLRRKNIPITNIEQKLLLPQHRTIYVELSSHLITYRGRKVILTLAKDITNKKTETDSLLQRSEKLALVGQMAAGIAHEIRNPLTSVKGFIQLFRSKYIQEEEYFDLILSEIERINLIVGEFLVLAKPGMEKFKETSIKHLLKDVVTLINSQALLHNIQIFLEFETDLPTIVCDINQLKQVFINIIKNSIEAIEDGGVIEIQAKRHNKNKIAITIIDNGMGIPKEQLPSIGNPFHTTKEKGTGLGLMVCHKIIENHNGEIKIKSKVKEGTSVTILLPSVEA